jgi:hypothetical protein
MSSSGVHMFVVQQEAAEVVDVPGVERGRVLVWEQFVELRLLVAERERVAQGQVGALRLDRAGAGRRQQ